MRYFLICISIFLFGFYEARHSVQDTALSFGTIDGYCITLPTNDVSYQPSLAWLSAAIGAAASLFKGGVSANNAAKNLQAQREANETNLKISRETNEANLNLAREQNQWNLDQWHREMSYNTPAAQMGRYTNAGINPYMAMNQLTNGNSTSNLQSANLANQMPTSVNPVVGSTPLNAFADDGMNAFIQMATTLANLENTQSVTDNNKAITPYIPKIADNTVKSGKLANEAAGYTNKRLQLYSSDAWLGNEADIQDQSVQQAKNLTNLYGEQVITEQMKRMLISQQVFEADTRNTYLEDYLAAGLADTYSNILTRSEQVAQGWKQIDLHEREVKIQEFLAPAMYDNFCAQAVKSYAEAHKIKLEADQLQDAVDILQSTFTYRQYSATAAASLDKKTWEAIMSLKGKKAYWRDEYVINKARNLIEESMNNIYGNTPAGAVGTSVMGIVRHGTGLYNMAPK